MISVKKFIDCMQIKSNLTKNFYDGNAILHFTFTYIFWDPNKNMKYFYYIYSFIYFYYILFWFKYILCDY
jgi:hypothetical protein